MRSASDKTATERVRTLLEYEAAHADAGPADVYLGLTGAVLGTIPTAAIYFGVYEWCKGRLESRGW